MGMVEIIDGNDILGEKEGVQMVGCERYTQVTERGLLVE